MLNEQHVNGGKRPARQKPKAKGEGRRMSTRPRPRTVVHITEPPTPTRTSYPELEMAYAYFNKAIFGDELPPCLLTLVAKGRSLGYFGGRRFETDAGLVTDEIALNPKTFKTRPLDDTLSTLVHEMTHLKQHHFGEPGRGGYHNKAWAAMMETIGLMPSNTGAPGGKRTGQQMTHYIIAGGPFDVACKALLASGFAITWKASDDAQKGKSGKRVKYSCGSCGIQVWGKPDLHLRCEDCQSPLIG